MCCFDVASHALLTTVGDVFENSRCAPGSRHPSELVRDGSPRCARRSQVVSEPAGADVFLSTGKVLATFRKRRVEQFLVTITKPGYYSQTGCKEQSVGDRALRQRGGCGHGRNRCCSRCQHWRMGFPLSKSGSVWLVLQPGEHPARSRRLASGNYPIAIPAERAGMVRSPYTKATLLMRARWASYGPPCMMWTWINSF